MRGEFVLYINHSVKYIEINFNMKIPYIYIYKYISRIQGYLLVKIAL